MDLKEIALQRLHNQQLLGTKITTAQGIVSYMGAIQAQDHSMCKWAVGIRTSRTEAEVSEVIDSGQVIRTHVLRPTWHLVAAQDARWMLELTAPSVRKLYLPTLVKLGIDLKALTAYIKIIRKILCDNNHLTREEIMSKLKLKGIYENDIRPALIMMSAEQEGVVCNGPMRGKQFTYALFDERVPATSSLKREEALARLAATYFTSHGPATMHDFSWWSGLPVADAKLAVELIRSGMNSVRVDGQLYWYCGSPKKTTADSVHFLPAFDEFLISYKDRTASIPTEHQPKAFTRNGIFKPIIVVNGKVAGIWKRSIGKDTALVETEYFGTVKKSQKLEHHQYVTLYGKHVEKDIVVR